MKQWIQNNGWTAGLATAVVLSLLSFAFPASLFTRLAATAVLVFALPMLVREGRAGLASLTDGRGGHVLSIAKKWWPYLVVAVCGLLVLGPVALGQMPVSQDHVNHYYATRIFVDEMIPSFRFFGWTDSLGTGYPFGDLYHTPSYLVTGLLHLVTFKTVSLPTSYAFGMVLALLIPALAITAWTKRLAGSFGGVLAGLLVVVDKGGDREGGWIYSMFHGVWPQSVGVGLWLFALLALWRLAEKPNTKRLAASVLLCGFSLWIHPMNTLTLIVAGFLMVVSLVLVSRNGNETNLRNGTAPVVVALLFAGLLGLVWVCRLMLSSDAIYAFPSNWRSTAELARTFLQDGPFAYQLAFVAGLSIVGVIYLARRRDSFGTFALILPAALIIIGSMDLIVGSDLGLAGGKLSLIQYRRFSIPAKPLWYGLAGVGLAVVISGLKSKAGEVRQTSYSSLLRRGAIALFLAPFVWGLLGALPALVETPVGNPLTLRGTGDASHVAAIRQVLEKERARCSDMYCKAVYWEKHGHGGLYPVMALADTGFEWQSTLKLPANNYKWQNPTTNFETLARLGVSVVVSKWELDSDRLEKIGTFGRHRVYRMKGSIPSRVEMDGPGKAQVVSWQPEKRVVKVAGTAADSSLTLLMPPYRKWSARQNGIELDLESVHFQGLLMSEVTGLSDGEIVIEYEDSLLESGLSVLGLIIVLCCGFLLFTKQRPLPLLDLLEKKKVHRILVATVVLLPVIGIVGIAIGGQAAVKYEWLDGEKPGIGVEAVLHRESLVSVKHYPEDYCLAPYVRNPNFDCNHAHLKTDLVSAKRRGGKIPSCLAIGIPPKGRTEITFDLPSKTSKLKGRFQMLSRSGIATGTVRLGTGPAAVSTPIGATNKKGGTFSIPVPRGSNKASFIFDSKAKTRICLEAVALSDNR